MTSKTTKKVKCPGCKASTLWEGNKWRPFCSERCKMLDLGAWASEEYKVPDHNIEYEDEIPEFDDHTGGYKQ